MTTVSSKRHMTLVHTQQYNRESKTKTQQIKRNKWARRRKEREREQEKERESLI